MLTNSLVPPILFLCLSMDIVQPTNVKDKNQWDLLIFTQQWPTTVCKEWKHNPSHKCSMPSKHDLWTIHGIWPTKFGTIGPAFCNRTWHFDPEAIRPIETRLTELWTNIETGTAKYSFWTHEWTKHGTCAAVLEPLNSELKYFSKGLDLLQNYSMNDILQEADIVPSNDKDYSIADIHNAIYNKLGVNPAIECRKEDGTNWLIEIRICFDKTLKLTNCDGIVGMDLKAAIGTREVVAVLTNCDTTQGIIYPEQLPNKPYVKMFMLVSWLQWLTL